MPKFQVLGAGRESGRARKKTYQANNEAHARSLAEADDMVVREVIELPPPPPTDGQLAKAAELGIAVPAGISSEELSSLISLTTWRDKKADHALRELAAGYGVAVNAYSGKKYLFTQIFQQLSAPGREHDLVAWFAYRVYRELVHGAAGMPITSPHDPQIQKVANHLAADQSVVQSIRRYSGDSLVWFGRYTTPGGAVLEGGSNRTTAYRSVAALVRPLANVSPTREWPTEERPESRPVERVTGSSAYGYYGDPPPSPPVQQPRLGCLGVIAVFVVVTGAATAGTAWLGQFV